FEGDYPENLDLFTDDKLQLGIGERLRLFAKRKYGTLKKLAEAMKISPQQLQQYISGKREPGTRIMVKLLKLGCDVNWLLGGKESIESYKIYKLETELRKLQSSFTQIADLTKKVESGH
ncbi:MAG: XRE family transcriptional regulator, partial [Ignavibacteriales bacterium]